MLHVVFILLLVVLILAYRKKKMKRENFRILLGITITAYLIVSMAAVTAISIYDDCEAQIVTAQAEVRGMEAAIQELDNQLDTELPIEDKLTIIIRKQYLQGEIEDIYDEVANLEHISARRYTLYKKLVYPLTKIL